MHICLVCPTCFWPHSLERGIHAYLSCLSEHARLVIFSVSRELTFPCGKACLWPHAFRTRFTCIFALFVRARSFVYFFSLSRTAFSVWKSVFVASRF